MEETKRTYYKYFPRNGKMTVFIDKRCTGCGHKEVDWERDVPLDEEKL